ncbi:MAG: type II secretion system protein [Candidatus Pacebacteria bacterium]|nr:type II secretion system protein [Candidatus Paceibacterota bacterium]
MRLMISENNGFTLIELLVVIAIIGVLSTIALTSMNESRRKASDAAFKSTARSIQATASVCCAGSAANFLENVLEADVCYPTMGSSYPGSESISSVEIVRDCGNTDGFQLRLVPGSDNDSGSVSYALCDGSGCSFIES